jgi:hypothetical protein
MGAAMKDKHKEQIIDVLSRMIGAIASEAFLMACGYKSRRGIERMRK